MNNQKKIHYDALLRSMCEYSERKGKYQSILETSQFFDDKDSITFFSSQIKELDEFIEQLRERILKKVVE